MKILNIFKGSDAQKTKIPRLLPDGGFDLQKNQQNYTCFSPASVSLARVNAATAITISRTATSG